MSFGVSSAVGSVLALVATVHLGRHLGVASFGTFSLGRTLAEYAVVAVTIGVAVAASKRIAQEPSSERDLVVAATTWRVAVALFAMAAMLVASILLHMDGLPAITAGLLGFVAFNAVTVDWVFSARENMSIPSMSRVAARVVYAGLIILLVKDVGDSLVAALILSTEAAIFAALVYFGYPNRSFVRLRPGVLAGRQMAELLRESAPIAGAQVARQLKTNVDLVLLGVLTTSLVVGWYAAAYRLVMFVNMLAGIFATVLLPRVVRAHADGEEQLRAVVSAGSELAIIAGLYLASVGAMAGGPLVRSLFGADYAQSATVMPLLMIASGFVVVSMSFGNVAIALGRSRSFMRVGVWGVALNIGLNLVAIPLAGMMGAAIITLATEAFLVGALSVVLGKAGVLSNMSASWLVRMLVVSIVAGVAAVGSTTLGVQATIAGILATVVFLGAGLGVGVFTPAAVERYRQVFRA